MPPTTMGTRSSPSARINRTTSCTRPDVRAGQDGQAEDVGLGRLGTRHDLGGSGADAVVNHLHAHRLGAGGDLFGAVGMAVQPRLADKEGQCAPEPFGGLFDTRSLAADVVVIAFRLDQHQPDAGGAAIVAEHGAQACPPTPPSSHQLWRSE